MFIAVLLKLKSNVLNGIDILNFEEMVEDPEADIIDDFDDDFEGEQLKMPTLQYWRSLRRKIVRMLLSVMTIWQHSAC